MDDMERIGLLVTGFGAVGGFVSWLAYKVYQSRQAVVVSENGILVFIYSVAVGSAGAFIFWSVSTVTSNEPAPFGIALLSGIFGTSIINALRQIYLVQGSRNELVDEVGRKQQEFRAFEQYILEIADTPNPQAQLIKLEELAAYIRDQQNEGNANVG